MCVERFALSFKSVVMKLLLL